MESSSDNTTSNFSKSCSTVSMKTSAASAEILLRKLLLVDDEVDGAELAAQLLCFHGIEVLVVHSAHEALRVLQDDKEIDAVLSDVMMPGMTGIQLAKAARELYPRIKVVLMSGYVIPDLLDNCERPYLFAEKPYSIDTVLKLLRS